MREDVFDHKSERNATNKSNAMPTITARILARMSVAFMLRPPKINKLEHNPSFSNRLIVVEVCRPVGIPIPGVQDSFGELSCAGYGTPNVTTILSDARIMAGARSSVDWSTISVANAVTTRAATAITLRDDAGH